MHRYKTLLALTLTVGIVAAWSPPSALAQPFDHLKCFKVKDPGTFKSAELRVIDVLALSSKCVIKKKAKEFCIPVQKTVTSIEDGTDEPFVGQDHFFDRLCYKLKCPATAHTGFNMTDQFGTRDFEKPKISEICMPAVKGGYPTSTTTSTTTTTTTVPTPPYTTYKPLMEQVVAAGPLFVTSNNAVPPSALLAAGQMLTAMLANREDVAQELRTEGAVTAVFGRDETVCDLLYFADLAGMPICTDAVGGLGGVPGREATGCSEKNLLSQPDDPFRRGQVDGENVCVHELAHTIMNVGLTNADRAAISTRYAEALTEGLWDGDYALQHVDEFFAEMTQAYFCANPEVPAFLHTHGVNCADELQDHDPDSFTLIDSIYAGAATDLR